MNEYRKKADAYINGLISEINANSAELFRLDPQTNGITSDENSIYYKLDHPEAANIQADDAQTPSDGSQPNDKWNGNMFEHDFYFCMDFLETDRFHLILCLSSIC